MGTYKAVLFDLDGTLINTLEDLAAASNHALAAYGYPPRPVEDFKLLAGNGVAVMLERAMPEGERTPRRIAALKEKFLEYYGLHYADKTAPYAGVPELLRTLKVKGYKRAVVTNKVEEMAKVILNKLYPNCFDLILGQREGVPTKPDPTLAHMAMKELGVSPEECVFMGDSGVDIQTAVNSGALPVGVLWGFREEPELLRNGAKRLIGRAEELLNILEEN